MLTHGGPSSVLIPLAWIPAVASLQDNEAFSLSRWYQENPAVQTLAGLLALVLVCLFGVFAVRKARVSVIRPLIERSPYTWDDVFLDASFFRWLSYLLVALVAYLGIGMVHGIDAEGQAGTIVRNLAQALMVVFGALSLGALLTAVNTIYSRREAAKSRPIKGYIQIAKIFVYVIGSVAAVAIAVGENPTTLLVGLGGMTAVLLLIFKDTILSLVASVQLTSNDMVQVGDWLEMPSVGADGDVIDVALHTVKVQNWDKTISTIPTHRLISESFKNWRGMQESGGRRIKRSINLDLATVRFLEEGELETFEKFALLRDYVADKRQALAEHNAEIEDQASELIWNARRLTNVGTFRAYVVNYLRSHPMVHDGMTFLVRQLQPTENGLPLEIYIFTSTTNWNEYEGIQADIFDHLLAILPAFGLRAFQHPSGADLQALVGAGAAADAPAPQDGEAPGASAAPSKSAAKGTRAGAKKAGKNRGKAGDRSK